MNADLNNKARYVMVGGFLGAGKTTSIQAFARHLDGRGLKVGLITNDQGGGLVDTALGRSNHFPVEEIAGGCFCCRFDSLVEAAANLSETTRPDVFLAEPVGSCTDLVATVNLPLQQIYGEDFTVSPLSVLIDPVRAMRVLGLEDGKRLSPNVCYIYEKQLEEAEIIVINKIDLLEADRLQQLRETLLERYPRASVLEMSARSEENLTTWFETVLATESNPLRLMEVDYGKYGEGESLLGWLNATMRIGHEEEEEFDGNALLNALASSLRELLTAQAIEVAHLKMTLTPESDPFEIAAVNLVRSDDQPYMSHHLTEMIEEGHLSLNIRAEASPDALEAATHGALSEIFGSQSGFTFKMNHLEAFRPGKPVPIHRLTQL